MVYVGLELLLGFCVLVNILGSFTAMFSPEGELGAFEADFAVFQAHFTATLSPEGQLNTL